MTPQRIGARGRILRERSKSTGMIGIAGRFTGRAGLARRIFVRAGPKNRNTWAEESRDSHAHVFLDHSDQYIFTDIRRTDLIMARPICSGIDICWFAPPNSGFFEKTR